MLFALCLNATFKTMGTATDVHYRRKAMKRRVNIWNKAVAKSQARKIDAHFKRIEAMRIEIAELKSTRDAQAEIIQHLAHQYEFLTFSFERHVHNL